MIKLIIIYSFPQDLFSYFKKSRKGSSCLLFSILDEGGERMGERRREGNVVRKEKEERERGRGREGERKKVGRRGEGGRKGGRNRERQRERKYCYCL